MDAQTLLCHKKYYAYQIALLGNKLAEQSFIGSYCITKTESILKKLNLYYQILCFVNENDSCISDTRLSLLLDKMNSLISKDCS